MTFDFIPGIYNYCDKWCERCAFQRRCSIYVDEEKCLAEREMSNEMLITVISEKLKGLTELFDERDTFLSFSSTQNQYVPLRNTDHEASIRPCFNDHPLIRKSYHYGRNANTWFRERHIDKFMHQYKTRMDMGLVSEQDIDNELNQVQGWIDQITRFITFIPVKLKRAISSAESLRSWEQANGFPNDCDGSAKVAIIAIEESISGWHQLMQCFPELEDVCLEFLSNLQQIRQLALHEFPLAMEFKRPGFDDEV